MAAPAAAVAATKPEKNKALAALTSAALGLPGMNASAAVAAAQASGNAQYGYYQESDNRMQVEVYHGDVLIPVTDRFEFTYSIDRDTYSGATPAFSMPETMTNQPQYKQKADGTLASETTPADVVSAASGGVTAQGLTQFGLNTFKVVQDGKEAAQGQIEAVTGGMRTGIDAAKNQEIAEYEHNNPRPPFPETIPGPVTLNFQGMALSAYAGKANLAPLGNGRCAGNASEGCYYEGNMATGTVNDPSTPTAHLHRNGGTSNRLLGYHSDSPGIFIRALNSAAFSLLSTEFRAPITEENPDSSPNDIWEIKGFNTALNPNLDTNPNSAAQVAYQTVANGFSGTLTLNEAFQYINAFWIHYKGYPQTPTDGKQFSMQLDNVKMDKAKFPDSTPEQDAWLAGYNEFVKNLDAKYEPLYSELETLEAELEKRVMIELYRVVLDKMVPSGTPTVQKFQYQPRETRTMPVFGGKYYFDNATLGFSGGYSSEPDFLSNFGSISFNQEFNEKHTTLSAGYSASSNTITRNVGGHATHHESNPNHNPTDYPDLDERSFFNSFNAGIGQVLSKNSLFQASANYTRQTGYLTNPYKFVYVRGEITPEEYYYLWQAPPGEVDWNSVTNLEVVGIELFRENRPDLRNQWSLSTALNQYIPSIDASLHLDYRFYADDWDIHSHTFEFTWYQPLPLGIAVTPSIRYYSQSAADFFAPYFLAPRNDGHYSSDFRLSAFGALSGGVTLSKQFTRGVRVEAGFEYYTHASSLKLGGGGSGNYADFDYFLAHAGLSVDLSAPSAPGFSGEDHSAHSMHHQHGAHVPAGVMFGHMMNQANDIMVGYRYMYGNQAGDMLRGSSKVSDTALVNSACGGLKCSDKPKSMNMNMHMLDLMYAPTDWLNLMLMPQLIDMDMSLAQLPGATGESEHGGGHSSDGLGDTLMVALVKLFDTSGHRLNLAMGLSAPTGDIDITLDGRDYKDSPLQDYGMQLGSGTWDLRPSLTYTGQMDKWSWGAQLSGTKRLEDRNDSGYALGDVFQSTAWGSYSPFNWLSGSLRALYTVQGTIRGEFDRKHSETAPVDYPSNYGGRFWDIGFGLNLSMPGGQFAGHNLGVEWLQPVADDFNGYQLERTGSLSVTWSYTF